MKKAELEAVINGKAHMEYNGNLFEYTYTEQIVSVNTGDIVEEREYFTDVNDCSHYIDFRAETILNCTNHFRIAWLDEVSK